MGNELMMCSVGSSDAIVQARVPSLSNLSAYIRQVNAQPMLGPEEERRCAELLRDEGSLDAAKTLVMSHLRLVVKIAREHSGYGLPQEDLIQEGNVGLMLAVKRFDPTLGVRLAAYAAIWIRSEIQEYVLSNWRIVKIGAAKGLKKLFFNLRKLQEQLHGTPRLRQKEEISRLLGVEADEVERAVQWFAGGEVALLGADPGDAAEPVGLVLPSPASGQPEQEAEALQWEAKGPAQLRAALGSLTDRERKVVMARYLDDDGGKTLAELARELGVSLERVRQIEVAALKKLRERSSELRQWL